MLAAAGRIALASGLAICGGLPLVARRGVTSHRGSFGHRGPGVPPLLARRAAAGLRGSGGLPPALARRGLLGPPPALGDLAAAWTLSLGNAAVLALAAGLAGCRLDAWFLAGLLVAPGVAVTLARAVAGPVTPAPVRSASSLPATCRPAAPCEAPAAAAVSTGGPNPAPCLTLGEGARPAYGPAPALDATLHAPGGRTGNAPTDGYAGGGASPGPPLEAASVPGAWGSCAVGTTRPFAAGRALQMRRLLRWLGELRWVSGLALAVGSAVCGLKMAAAPLWSWDHFAIWGLKARCLLAGGHLRLDFLLHLYQSRVDHPLGLPMAWLVLTLGQAPDPADFKLLHVLFAAVLAILLYAAVVEVTASADLGRAAAACLVISPLFWDTEAVGLAELPLALWAVAALYLLLRRRLPEDSAPASRPWAPGLVLGFLPWIKQEGLPLALGVAGVGVMVLLSPAPGAEQRTEPSERRAGAPQPRRPRGWRRLRWPKLLRWRGLLRWPGPLHWPGPLPWSGLPRLGGWLRWSRGAVRSSFSSRPPLRRAALAGAESSAAAAMGRRRQPWRITPLRPQGAVARTLEQARRQERGLDVAVAVGVDVPAERPYLRSLVRLAYLGAPVALLLAAALFVQARVLPPGATFFAGDWWRRGLDRLPVSGVAILRHCAGDLLQPDWLGFWLVMAVTTAGSAWVAWRRRRLGPALVLAAAVWCQVSTYALTAMFSYIPPDEHLNAAFFRICGPLVPLGLLAIALAAGPSPAPRPAGHPRPGAAERVL